MSTRRIRLPAVPLALAAAVALASARQERTGPAPAAPKTPAPVVVSVDVAKLWEHKALLPVREARGRLEFAWMVQSLIGLAPTEIERLTLVVPKPDAEPILVVTGRNPVDPAAVAKTLTRKSGVKGPKPTMPGMHVAPGAEFPYVRPVDARTVLLAPLSAGSLDLTRLAEAFGPKAAERLAGSHTVMAAVDVRSMKGVFGDQVPAELLAADGATLTADLPDDKTAKVALALTFPDAAGAKAAAPVTERLLRDVGRWAAEREKTATVGPAGEFARPLFEGIIATLKTAKVRADGSRLVVSAELDLGESVSRVLAAVPDAVLTGQGAGAGENNLKQILLALHNYHDVNGKFPTNTYDKDGKPLLSWRVAILPYIEQAAVYQGFKQDEPWDSPHNKQFSQLALKVFMVPGRPAGQLNETYFRAFVAPKNVKPEYRPWLVEGETKGVGLTSITDGTSNTILVVEAGEAVPWAKPDDLPYDGVMALPRLGGPGGRFLAGMGDGSVRTLRRDRIDEKTLRALITIQGGEVVAIP
jgi:hypothetical protein